MKARLSHMKKSLLFDKMPLIMSLDNLFILNLKLILQKILSVASASAIAPRRHALVLYTLASLKNNKTYNGYA